MKNIKTKKFPESIVKGFYVEQHAEMDLINPIIKNNIIDTKDILYFLAKYPVSPLGERGEIVCNLMKNIWPSDIGSDQFEIFRKFESFLSVLGKRDHFFHQFLVYLIGVNFINKILEKCSDKEKVFGFASNDDIYKTWLMASTYHDFGYPISVIEKINLQLSKFYKGLGLNNISIIREDLLGAGGIENLLSEAELAIDNNLKKRNSIVDFFKSLLKIQLNIDDSEAEEIFRSLSAGNNHGYISSIMLYKILCNKILYEKHLNYALPAIFCHVFSGELEKFQPKIKFSSNPYSYLLFLIDNIQDWSRSFIENEKYANFTLTEFSINDSNINIAYYLSNNKWSDALEKEVVDGINGRKKAILAPENDLKIGIGLEIDYFLQFSDSPITISTSL